MYFIGLGKINLSELNQLPISDRAVLGKLKRLKKKADAKPRIIIKKHVDKKVCILSKQIESGANL